MCPALLPFCQRAVNRHGERKEYLLMDAGITAGTVSPPDCINIVRGLQAGDISMQEYLLQVLFI